MKNRIDPHISDADYLRRRAARREAEGRKARLSAGMPTFDDIAFRRGGTYNGNPQALARMAARAGMPRPEAKPGTVEE